MSLVDVVKVLKGGVGSGNFGHGGRLGKRGGSSQGVGGVAALIVSKSQSVPYPEALETFLASYGYEVQ